MIKPTEKSIGKRVVLRQSWMDECEYEHGVITSFNKKYVSVLYDYTNHSKSTSRKDLYWERKGLLKFIENTVISLKKASVRFVDLFIVHILRRNCYTCTHLELVEKQSQYHKQFYCEHAMDWRGLVEPTKTSLCEKYLRKKKENNI